MSPCGCSIPVDPQVEVSQLTTMEAMIAKVQSGEEPGWLELEPSSVASRQKGTLPATVRLLLPQTHCPSHPADLAASPLRGQLPGQPWLGIATMSRT